MNRLPLEVLHFSYFTSWNGINGTFHLYDDLIFNWAIEHATHIIHIMQGLRKLTDESNCSCLFIYLYSLPFETEDLWLPFIGERR